MLKVNEVFFNYGIETDLTEFYLSEISFEINAGEFVAILGPNGSGKSTLLKLIANLIKPVQGQIDLDGRPVKNYSAKSLAKKLAYVPQSTISIFPYSVYEIVAMGRNPHHSMMGFENEKDLEVIKRSLEIMELDKLAGKSINEVSGGEAQRTFIARALAQEPQILLLDEPNSHLDIKHQLGIFDILRDLHETQSLTVILVSHDMNHALTYCERGILLNNGNIICDDKINAVLNPGLINETFGIDSEIVQSIDGKYKSILIRSNLLDAGQEN